VGVRAGYLRVGGLGLHLATKTLVSPLAAAGASDARSHTEASSAALSGSHYKVPSFAGGYSLWFDSRMTGRACAFFWPRGMTAGAK